MATIEPIRGDWPQVIIRIETSGNLDLGNVARLLERLNTGIHRAYPGAPPRIEIVAIETGSIELRVAVLAVVLTAGQLALDISDHLQSDPPAARACNDVFDRDNGDRIIIIGGKQRIVLSPDDIENDLEYGVADRRIAGSAPPSEPRAIATVAYGIFQGTIERISGEYYIQLTDRPGLFLRIRDERPSPDVWDEHNQYRVEGRAYFAPRGKPSAFVVISAMRL